MNLPKKLSSVTQLKVSITPQRTDLGFTLIELLVVIAIIAILVSIGAASYMAAQRNARDQARTKDLNQVKTALEQYFELNDYKYPVSNAGKIKCGVDDIPWGNEWVCNSHRYMRALPEDPTGTLQYCYVSPAGTDFSLYGNMENASNGNTSPPEPCGPNDYNYKLENEK